MFDVIVAGMGGMGSAACDHLARRGQRVLGLERLDIPRAKGSSHGVNRIIPPDGDVLPGLCPAPSQVVLASPSSGRGYKFCSVIGEVLADFATKGRTVCDIAFPSPARAMRAEAA